MNSSPIIKPTKDLVIAVKTKTDNLPASPANEATLTAMKQKDTSPAFNSDTDSLEALREAIAASAAPLYTDTGTIVEDTTTGIPKIVSVNTAAGANTFGAWVEFDTAVSADSYVCSIMVSGDFAADIRNYCVELGVGANGSEVTKVRFSFRTLQITNEGIANPAVVYTLSIPIKVASGLRIALRMSCSLGGAVGRGISVQYYQGL